MELEAVALELLRQVCLAGVAVALMLRRRNRKARHRQSAVLLPVLPDASIDSFRGTTAHPLGLAQYVRTLGSAELPSQGTLDLMAVTAIIGLGGTIANYGVRR